VIQPKVEVSFNMCFVCWCHERGGHTRSHPELGS
jgi:hypothetical protein